MSVFKEAPENQCVALCYTFSEAFSPLLVSLGKMGKSLIVFNKECDELHQKLRKIIQEAKILVPELEVQQTSNWKDVGKSSIVVFLNLDIDKSSEDKDFFALCKREFKDRSVPKECLILFSGNYRGLIAANVYSDAYPDLAKRIHVVSSIFYGSVLIFGEKENAKRAISKPKGDIFVFGGSEESEQEEGNLVKIDQLRGVWAHDEFQTLESAALFSFIDLALTTGDVSSCEITGRLPGDEEVPEFDITKDIITWLPISETVQINSRGFFKNIRGVAASIEEVANSFEVPIDSGSSDLENDMT